jgi:hypothetical protein
MQNVKHKKTNIQPAHVKVPAAKTQTQADLKLMHSGQ